MIRATLWIGHPSWVMGWRGFVAVMIAGALAAFGQAPWGLWPLAIIGFGFLYHRLFHSQSPRMAFWQGTGFGAGWFGLGLSWIVQPFFVDPWMHGWMAPFAISMLAFGFGLFWGFAAAIARKLRQGGGAVLLFSLLLSLVELARGHVFTGFPWALPGHIWSETFLIQMASLIGAYGMTALTLVALALPFVFGARKGLIATGLIAILSLSWALHRLALPEPTPRAAIVRIVQPNIEQSLKWHPEEARRNFEHLLRLSQGGQADLVIWPETAIPYEIVPGLDAALAVSEAAGGRPVLAGYQRFEGFKAWNSLGLFEGQGQVTQNFDKMHLVPFGEYMPAGDLLFEAFGIRAFAAQAGAGYSAGETRLLFDLGAQLGQALPLICYEALFPADLVTDHRGDWMVQATNDAWFGTISGPYQHFAQTRLRAIEQGLPMLRAANTGISAVIDARGRLALDLAGNMAALPLGVDGVIDAQIPGALGVTPYLWVLTQFGEWPLVLLLLIGAIVSYNRRERRGAVT